MIIYHTGQCCEVIDNINVCQSYESWSRDKAFVCLNRYTNYHLQLCLCQRWVWIGVNISDLFLCYSTQLDCWAQCTSLESETSLGLVEILLWIMEFKHKVCLYLLQFNELHTQIPAFTRWCWPGPGIVVEPNFYTLFSNIISWGSQLMVLWLIWKDTCQLKEAPSCLPFRSPLFRSLWSLHLNMEIMMEWWFWYYSQQSIICVNGGSKSVQFPLEAVD